MAHFQNAQQTRMWHSPFLTVPWLTVISVNLCGFFWLGCFLAEAFYKRSQYSAMENLELVQIIITLLLDRGADLTLRKFSVQRSGYSDQRPQPDCRFDKQRLR